MPEGNGAGDAKGYPADGGKDTGGHLEPQRGAGERKTTRKVTLLTTEKATRNLEPQRKKARTI